MIEVRMPTPGQTVEEAVIVTWAKSEGDEVAAGEVIAEIETDKAVFELESPGAGTMLKILYGEESVVPVRALIALIGEAGEDADAYATTAAEAAEEAAAAKVAPMPAGPQAAAAPSETAAAPAAAHAGRPNASPAARALARRLGVDLARVAGSGPGGLVTSGDVEKAAKAPAAQAAKPAQPPAAPVASGAGKPLSKMRKAIAANLTWSKQNIPHFYMSATIDAEALERHVGTCKSRFQCGINDVVVMAVAKAVAEFPRFAAASTATRLSRRRARMSASRSRRTTGLPCRWWSVRTRLTSSTSPARYAAWWRRRARGASSARGRGR